MSDSMCGPSNALQNFQKHSTVDRTLQQDRLVARAPQSQGFRSVGHSAGALNPEFEAFQAGQLPLQHSEPQHFSQGFHAAQRMNNVGSAGSAAWANDFQKMSLSPAPGLQQTHLSQPQQQIGGGWHEEFRQAQNHSVSAEGRHGFSAPVERLSSIAGAPFGMQTGGNFQNTMLRQQPLGFYNAQSLPQNQQQQPLAQAEAFDEEAFARAFDQAAETELAAQISEGASLSQEIQDSSQTVDEPIGADAIHHPDDADYQPMTPQQESDDLAKTAGQLLNSVKDNHSDKFQQSVFLQLMRQLRDKEVVVQGDKIRPANEANAASSASDIAGVNEMHQAHQ